MMLRGGILSHMGVVLPQQVAVCVTMRRNAAGVRYGSVAQPVVQVRFATLAFTVEREKR